MQLPERQPLAVIAAWCLYDWAYSAFSTIVVTFVIATYFVHAVAQDVARGTVLWAWAQAAAGIVVALTSAPLGAIADHSGQRRPMLIACTLLMAGSTALLWYVRPAPAYAPLALALVALATILFETATVFYNAMLPDLVPLGRVGRVSELAWGAGYAGGLVCLGTCLVLLINPDPPLFGLTRETAEPVRATAIFAAVWIVLFSCPLFILAKDRSPRQAWPTALRTGLKGVTRTVRSVAGNPCLGRFLFARMLYTDGLTTLFAFGAIYAAGTFGMDAREVLLLGIGLNVAAALGAACFAALEDDIGPKATVLIALAAMVALGAALLLARTTIAFWGLALCVGCFVGPAQAASRSLMAKLAPPASRAAHFGLYALSGRVTGFVGPAALGALTSVTNSQRAGMTVILVLLAAGGAILLATPTPATSG